MTPRTNCVWLDLDDSWEVLRQKIISSSHSRLPVIQGSLDNIIGIALARNLLARSLAGQPIDLRQQVHPPLFVPESMWALKALEQFRQSGIHLALVIDEYGGFEGPEMVGEMPPLEQPQKLQAVQREDGSWLLDGMLPVEECRKILRLEKLPPEEDDSFHTLAGFMLSHLGRIPAVADHFEWGGYRFEVVDMDQRRIDRVLVAPFRQANRSIHRRLNERLCLRNFPLRQTADAVNLHTPNPFPAQHCFSRSNPRISLRHADCPGNQRAISIDFKKMIFSFCPGVTLDNSPAIDCRER